MIEIRVILPRLHLSVTKPRAKRKLLDHKKQEKVIPYKIQHLFFLAPIDPLNTNMARFPPLAYAQGL